MEGEQRRGAEMPSDDEDAVEAVGLVALSLDELAALQAAILLAEEALTKALASVRRHEGEESALARELGSALAALATTEDDLTRTLPDDA